LSRSEVTVRRHTEDLVAKPELTLELASATSMEDPIMGFDIGHRLYIVVKVVVLVVVPLTPVWTANSFNILQQLQHVLGTLESS
jgi:hypothetical protein